MITEVERLTLKELSLDELRRAFLFLKEGHEQDAHGGRTLWETGLMPDCIRCEWLLEMDLRGAFKGNQMSVARIILGYRNTNWKEGAP